MAQTKVTSDGIKQQLSSFDINQSIAEFIWNGFDAGATTLSVDITHDVVDGSRILITDDGSGIPRSELEDKFDTVFSSKKQNRTEQTRYINSLPHGKNGYGRLTFFCFAEKAIWETIYTQVNQKYKYHIEILSNQLDDYCPSDEVITDDSIGTKVKFLNVFEIENHKQSDLIKYLSKEFGWFLELNKKNNYLIKINGTILDYSEIIANQENNDLEINNYKFKVSYTQWNQRINCEFSRHYFLNSSNQEISKITTKLNRKGDNFFHSVIIKGDFFDVFNPGETLNPRNRLERGNKTIEEAKNLKSSFKYLIENVEEFLKLKRKPFLRNAVHDLVLIMEDEGILPEYKNSLEAEYKKPELINLIENLYQIEPKLFKELTIPQKKTFVRLLNLALDSGERETLFSILEEVIDLDPLEREEMSKILKTSKLTNIIKTIRMIEDRCNVINALKEMVWSENVAAKECDIQDLVEDHYWIFGEQYHLIASEEQSIEEALNRYRYYLYGYEDEKKFKLEHEHKEAEMDIFMCRRRKNTGIYEHIIVELKHPNVKLGKKELSQVENYLRAIATAKELNSSKAIWRFYMVSNDFAIHQGEHTEYLKDKMESLKTWGDESLVLIQENMKYRAYAKTWSEVFEDFELKHDFLLEKLKLERSKIQPDISLDGIKESLEENTAAQNT